MISVLSREEMRAFDRHAIERCRVPSLVLMENAGRGAAEVIEERLGSRSGKVTVVAGPGNNGGDGFVVARRLVARGKRVTVCLPASPARLAGDALANYQAWIGIGGTVVPVAESDLGGLSTELEEASIVVDALFGTGLDRPLSGLFSEIVDRINGAPGLCIALDIPSGLDANTGRPLGVAVRAHETITFAHPKLGLLTSIGAEHAGKVTVADIGVPGSLAEAIGTSARVLEQADAASWLSPRSLATHKGVAGRVVAVAGSAGKTGAALLVARGALRAGAGLVTIVTFPDAADALDRRVVEEMTARIDPARPEASLDEHLSGADAVVIGPGIGLDARALAVVDHVVFRYPGFLVVDADALTHLAGRLPELKRAKGRLVLTPHPGEMARLLGRSAADVEGDRFGALREAVRLSGAVVLLKGARTLVGAPGELPIVNPSGTPALATAGSGDVLAGILGALFPAVRDPERAAALAAYVHGRSGERWAEVHGAERGLLAHEVADGVPAVLAGLTRPSGVLPD